MAQARKKKSIVGWVEATKPNTYNRHDLSEVDIDDTEAIADGLVFAPLVE